MQSLRGRTHGCAAAESRVLRRSPATAAEAAAAPAPCTGSGALCTPLRSRPPRRCARPARGLAHAGGSGEAEARFVARRLHQRGHRHATTAAAAPRSGDFGEPREPPPPYAVGDSITAPDGTTYHILRLLGTGSFGATFEAEMAPARVEGTPAGADVAVAPATVALKVLSLRAMGSWRALDRFQAEARVLAALSHPAIPRHVAYFETDTDADRRFHLAQRVAPGDSLQALVGRGWRPTEADAVEMLSQLLGALAYLGALRPPVVHRDVSPGNVVWCAERRLLSLVDFGFAAEEAAGGSRAQSVVFGSYGFTAPETLLGTAATTASDLYSVGAVLLWLLAGGRSPAELPRSGLRPDTSAVTIASAPLRALLEALLEPEPSRRPPTADAALEWLRTGRAPRGAWLESPRVDAAAAPLALAAAGPPPAGGRLIVEEQPGGALLVTIPPAGVSADTFVQASGAVGSLLVADQVELGTAAAAAEDGSFTFRRLARGRTLTEHRGRLLDVTAVEVVLSSREQEGEDSSSNGQRLVGVQVTEGAREHVLGQHSGLSAPELRWLAAALRQRARAACGREGGASAS